MFPSSYLKLPRGQGMREVRKRRREKDPLPSQLGMTSLWCPQPMNTIWGNCAVCRTLWNADMFNSFMLRTIYQWKLCPQDMCVQHEVTSVSTGRKQMKATQMRTSRGYLFRTCYSKRVSDHHLGSADSKTGRWVGKLFSGKRKGFRYSLIGGCWRGEAVGWLSAKGHPVQLVSRASLGFSSWS